MTFAVYVTDSSDPSLEHERRVLADTDASIVFSDCKSEDDVAEKCADADALLVGSQHIGSRSLDALSRCRLIVRLGIGVDVIDVDECTARGILVANVPDYCVPEVADHAMALVLALARQVITLDQAVRAGRWKLDEQASSMRRLSEMSLGLVGLGRIGSSIATRAASFGLRVVASDPRVDTAEAAKKGAEVAALETVLTQSDFVVVSCPLTEATWHLIDRAALDQMKHASYLVNVSRGSIVDEAALVAALEAGAIAGAGLDVFESEPVPQTSPLTRMANVILTPHAAHHSTRAHVELHTRAAAEVARLIRGEPPLNVVNRDAIGRAGRSLNKGL